MTKAEKIKHFEDYKACFRNVCTDFIKGDYKTASYIHGLNHLNKRLAELADVVVTMEDGQPV